jgi:hypothetical protein
MIGIFQKQQKPFNHSAISCRPFPLKKEVNMMRRRAIRIQVWVNHNENAKLQASAKTSGLSQEGYIRSLINGYVPKTMPPPDYFAMMRELHAIGNNLNPQRRPM